MHIDQQLTRAVLRVGDGRSFVVEHLDYLGLSRKIIITAAHCLECATLADGSQRLPPCHLGRCLEEQTYRELLGPLGGAPAAWAECLFADSIADIAVLGRPGIGRASALEIKSRSFD